MHRSSKRAWVFIYSNTPRLQVPQGWTLALGPCIAQPCMRKHKHSFEVLKQRHFVQMATVERPHVGCEAILIL